MIGTRARGLVATAALASLLCGCAASQTGAQVHGPRAASTQPTVSSDALVRVKFSSTPSIVNGRFTKPFELDDGALTVMPLTTSNQTGRDIKPVLVVYQPFRNVEAVARQAWSTAWEFGRAGLIGVGRVTISKSYKGAAPVKNLVAWVALADDAGATTSCPAHWGPYRHSPKLPAGGQSAVVIGDARGSAAVVFTARRFSCGYVIPATASDASQELSVPWVYRDAKVSVTVPACSFNGSPTFDSSPTSTGFSYTVQQLEAPASAVSPATQPGCAPARSMTLHDSFSRNVNAKTRHSRSAGPVLTLVPCLLPQTGRSPVQDLKNTAVYIPKKLATCAWHPSAN